MPLPFNKRSILEQEKQAAIRSQTLVIDRDGHFPCLPETKWLWFPRLGRARKIEIAHTHTSTLYYSTGHSRGLLGPCRRWKQGKQQRIDRVGLVLLLLFAVSESCQAFSSSDLFFFFCGGSSEKFSCGYNSSQQSVRTGWLFISKDKSVVWSKDKSGRGPSNNWCGSLLIP